MFNGDDNTEEEFIAQKTTQLWKALSKRRLSAYWSAVLLSYSRVRSAAIWPLILFLLTWMCEAGLSALLKEEQRKRTRPEIN